MLNKEESSVKLNLGNDNHEESEDEYEDEEEEEEDIIQEEDDVVDFQFGEDANVILGSDDNNAYNSQPTKNNQPTIDENSKHKTEEDKNIRDAKNAKSGQTNIGYDNHKSDYAEKTVFTRISEDIYNKCITNKNIQNKKASAYDYLINDMFLNRVVERNDKDSSSKFKNFVKRNREFTEKKTLKLQEITEKISNELNSGCTGIPNGKIPAKEDLRDPKEFLNDQIKYFASRDQHVINQRDLISQSIDAQMKSVPEISKMSKELAQKKLSADNSNSNVYDRLFKDKLNREKKIAVSNELTVNYNKTDNEMKLKTRKPKEINDLVEKLFKDAFERKIKKEEFTKNSNKLYDVYDSDDDITTNSSKLKILERFVQGYELILNKLFNKKDSVLIKFNEFCNLMYNLGFTRYDHQSNCNSPGKSENLHEENNDKGDSNDDHPKNTLNNKNLHSFNIQLNELELLRKAWKIISSNHEEIDEERIDTNQLIVFCASLLGLYKGELPPENTEVDENNNILNTNPNNYSHEKEEIMGAIVGDSLHKKCFSEINSNKNMRQNENKLFNKTNRLDLRSGSKTTSNPKAKKIDFYNLDRENINLLKKVIPELDVSKYQFFRSTVKQIKMMFRCFYLNRVEYLVEIKKNQRAIKLKNKNKDGLNNNSNSFSNPKINQIYNENFRKRLYEEIETEISKNNEESKVDHPNYSSHQNARKLKINEVYDIMRKKKENKIAEMKIQKEKDELMLCTFQPNVLKSSKKINSNSIMETVNKLYQDGVNKIRSKKEQMKEQTLDSMLEYTFKPKVNEFKSEVFDLNPLIHDKNIDKEIKRVEKARLERKITDILIKRGMSSIGQIKDINSFLLEEDRQPKMQFSLEKKTYKDTIDVQANLKTKTDSDLFRKDFKNTAKFKTVTSNDPLLNIEVNIDETNRVKKLEIYPNDDPNLVVANFCQKYGLSEDKKLRLQKIIDEKLNENYN